MSLQRKPHRITVADIINRKGGDPIVSLTSYHAHTAAIVDTYAEVILVGDKPWDGDLWHGQDHRHHVRLDYFARQSRGFGNTNGLNCGRYALWFL